MKSIQFLFVFVFSMSIYAQEIIMQNGSSETCSGTIADSGGAGGNYQNGENYTYTICPVVGSDAVQLDFTEFNLESGWDYLYIYDGDSTSAQLLGQLTGTTNPGNIGASYENTSGCLTLVFTSDSSVNRPGFVATISCFTPVFVETYLMQDGTISTCSGALFDTGGNFGNYQNSENYTLTLCSDVDIQAMSLDFTSFNLESNFDFLSIYDGADTSAPLIGSYTGTTSPGFVAASDTNDSGCLTLVFTSDGSVNRAGFSASIDCFTPTLPNNPVFGNCSVLDVSEDTEVGCNGGPCTEISASIGFDLIGGGADTSTYNITNVNCPLEIQQGTPVSVNIDDVWSSIIDIEFDFSFFGNTYNQLLIGSNGLLTFDLTDANGYCDWSFSESAPSTSLQTNAIFGAYHDIDPSVCGQISYYITGTAPYRAFVVNFDEVCHFSCNSMKTSQHIILYETSNIIEVYIDNKPTCTNWNGGRALIGIQNAAGTVAYVPAGRNTGNWTATNEQWRFVPDDEITIEYDFEWLDGTTVVSNDLNTIVCPTDDTVYTAHLNYTINGQTYDLTNDVTITAGPTGTVEATQPEDLMGCLEDDAALFDLTAVTDEVLGGQTNGVLTFYTSQANAMDALNPIDNPESVYVNSDYVIWVRVDDENSDCFALTNFNLLVFQNGNIPIGTPENMTACSTEVNGETTVFDLSSQDESILNGTSGGTITYYTSLENATSGTDALDTTYTNVSNPETIYARLENETGCYNTTSFDLIVYVTPGATQPENLTSCNEGFGIGVFNIEALVATINGGTSHMVSFYTTMTDAETNVNQITNTTAYESSAGTVYASVSSDDGCRSFTSFELMVENCIPTIPNAFSPNGDQKNDKFSIEGLKNVFSDFKITIYNRWGNAIFTGDNSTEFWDGSENGVISDNPEAATFFYVLEFNDGINEPKKGWIYVNP